MPMLEMKITGLREVDNALKQLPLKLQRKVLSQAASAGATVIKKEAKRLAPVQTGTLKKSIVAKKKKGSKAWFPIYLIGPSQQGWYGRLVEFGWMAKGARFIPGTRWLTKAADNSYKKAIQKVQDVLRKNIGKEAQKVGLKVGSV